MEGFDEKLEKILSSPETMSRIAALAGELSGKEPPKDESGAEPLFPEGLNLPAIAKTVGNLADDRRIGVLKSLKAQTEGESAKTVDRAILAIKIAKTVKTVLPEVEF